MVAAGAVAKKWLRQQFGTEIRACVTQIGSVPIAFESWDHVHNNPFFAPAADVAALEEHMGALRKSGDSCGAKLFIEATGVPVGWGEPLFDRLDADIAHAMMGINAVKGVEIGAGFAAVADLGSTHGDSLTPHGFVGNKAGGILGGISSGQPITVNLAIKPTSSILVPRDTVDMQGQAQAVITKGRHDPCVGLRAAPIAEAMLALKRTPASPRTSLARRVKRRAGSPFSSTVTVWLVWVLTKARAGPLSMVMVIFAPGPLPLTVLATTSAPSKESPGETASGRRGLRMMLPRTSTLF